MKYSALNSNSHTRFLLWNQVHLQSGIADAVYICLQKYSYLERPRGKPQEQVNIAVDALARLVAGQLLQSKVGYLYLPFGLMVQSYMMWQFVASHCDSL